MERSSGILLHISSLPSPYGIGTFGKAAREFVDFLKRAGQKYWQILPIGPCGEGNSPYCTYSAFAGNPWFIDPDMLMEEGLLLKGEADRICWGMRKDQVDFEVLKAERLSLLRLAFRRFSEKEPADYAVWAEEERDWLPDYALFMAVKQHLGGRRLEEWPDAIRLRRKAAMERYRLLLQDEIRFQCFLQYIFRQQWQQLRNYAHENGIRIIGDIPIYVPMDSADVWANPENFRLTWARRPKFVAGCPPDGFNEDGQFWGNPIYHWKHMKKDGFSWWLRRIGAAGRLFDMIRIDHFRGIESYWSIPAGEKTAAGGRWVKGPGMALISAIQAAYPALDFIAEDLGFLTPDVYRLVDDSGWPGMKVLEFAFDPEEPSIYLPHRYDENCICYTGTHDNETLCQWCESQDSKVLKYTRDYLGISSSEDLPDAILRAGCSSKARLFVAQMQDYLRLGEEARMNQPGKVLAQNWRWRMLPGAADEALAEKIRSLAENAGRT